MSDAMIDPGTNTGVIIKPIKPTDFYAGGESGSVKTVLELTGNYATWLPDEETQLRNTIDIFACVAFSALNNLEIIFNYKITHKILSDSAIKFLTDNGYIDPMTGKVNFSDRFTAKMSGTTKSGNSLGAVGDSIVSNHGLVPEKIWPWPSEMTDAMTPDEKWNLYYQDIPASVQTMAKKFLDHFGMDYEWTVLQGITADPSGAIKNALKYGPVQIASMICYPWNSTEGMPPIVACGCGTGHATTIYGDRTANAPWSDFDSFKSYRKLLDPVYCIPYAMQYGVSEKTPGIAPAVVYTFNANLFYGASSSFDLTMLQKALQYLGYMKVGVFGPYGPQTRTAVYKFQVANGIIGDDGSNFGPKSRSAMNKILNK